MRSKACVWRRFRSIARLFKCLRGVHLKKSTMSGSYGNEVPQTREKSVETENSRLADGVQSEKRVDVTPDLPFDFVRAPDTTPVLWKKLGLPLPNLEESEDQLEKNLVQLGSVTQRRLYRGGVGIKKGQLLENCHFGPDFQEFCSERVDAVYEAIEKLPFGFSEETIASFARVTLIRLYRFRTSQKILKELDQRRSFDEFLTAADALSRSLKSIKSNAILKSKIRFRYWRRCAIGIGRCRHRHAL